MQTGKPWPKVRALKDYEWKRDRDEDIQDESRHRSVNVVYAYTELDKPWYSLEDSTNPAGYYKEAVFQETNGIKEFRIAKRLIPKNIGIGDYATLKVAGCCTVLEVTPTDDS